MNFYLMFKSGQDSKRCYDRLVGMKKTLSKEDMFRVAREHHCFYCVPSIKIVQAAFRFNSFVVAVHYRTSIPTILTWERHPPYQAYHLIVAFM